MRDNSIIPAQPGFFALTSIESPTDYLFFAKEPVIGWHSADDGFLRPVCLDPHWAKDAVVLLPDGRVMTRDGGFWPSEAHWQESERELHKFAHDKEEANRAAAN